MLGRRNTPTPTCANCQAERCIENDLAEKELAQALAGVVKRRGRALNVARTGKTDEAVSKILPLQQHEGHEDHDDSCPRER